MNIISIPMIPLRNITVFPNMSINLDIGRKKALAAIELAMLANQEIFLVAQKSSEVEDPTLEDLEKVGTVSRIKQVLKLPGETIRVLVEGLYRAELVAIGDNEDAFSALIIENIQEFKYDENEAEALMRIVLLEFEKYLQVTGKLPSDTVQSIKQIKNPSELADILAANVIENHEDRQRLLQVFDPIKRLELFYSILSKEVQISDLEKKIALRVKKQMDKTQKEYYLREQIKAISKELGDGETTESEELRQRINESDMPDEVKNKAIKELDRMTRMSPGMPEQSLIRTYLEWLLELPWKFETEDNLDLENARRILDENHYGMEKVKERILEFLAVHTLTGSMKGPIICLVGPPGVGKTSIAQSIATALNRKFVRMSLGGVRDEAEIRGHRRTYVGAMPGRIIFSMKQAGSINPLFLFDEIDKMSHDFRGDPASAMLEVLDSEQNNTFRDHFLEVPYDLSKVLFITTANSIDTIPRPLLDRMEIIELSSYTDFEKLQIAKRHLFVKQLKEHGIGEDMVTITDDAFLSIINDYTREAGVRNLERKLAALCRKIACKIVSKQIDKIQITPENLHDYLGAKKYHREDVNKRNAVGIATGLAWTSVGGETLSIEVSKMPGEGKLVLTGQLGDVMKESARAGLSILRANSENWGINKDFYKEMDIHIHIPEGAMPKDGPSAGVTMFTAMMSVLTNTPVRSDTAMTGEITLSGQVLPIGGLKEKALAAYRAGIRRIVIPEDNLKDIEEIPEEVSAKIEFMPVKNIEELLKHVLADKIKESGNDN